ncbi:oligogalacturonate-specific porin KdgM family protein [Aeromonas veronii]
MKVSRIAALTLLGLLGSAATAHAATLNYRHEYTPDKGEHKDRVAISHRLANGVGFGAEAKWRNEGKGESYLDFFNNIKADGSVFTLNYQYKLNDQWSFQPGVQLDSGTSRSDYQVFVRAGYNVTKDFSTSLRYRWRMTNEGGHGNYDKPHRDNLTLNLGYKLTPAITVGYELDYNDLDRDAAGSNGIYSGGFANKSKTWDHNLSLGYKINKEWEPFVEFGWIQGNERGDTPGYKDTYIPRYRVGLKYNF